jgi:hypothetical protein
MNFRTAISFVVAPLIMLLVHHDGAPASAGALAALRASSGGWMAPDADRKHPWLYVATSVNNQNAIWIYDLGKHGFPVVGEITKGLSWPCGIALDAQNTLYVPNFNGHNVTIYPLGSKKPSLTLSQGLTNPASVAIDTNGDVYVLNRGGSVPDILVYPAGQTVPSETITSSVFRVPGQLVFDAARNLYVTDYGQNAVYEIPFGSRQPVSLGFQGLTQPSGLALDPATGSFFVGNLGGKTSVVFFPQGSTNPSFSLPNTPYTDFLSMATLHGKEYVVVTASQGNAVQLFRSGKSSPKFTITAPMEQVFGTAFKPGVP